MVRICIAVLAVALGVLTFPAALFSAPVDVEIEQIMDHLEYQLETLLVRYRFSEANGSMTSAFLHFATFREQPKDAVPGWEVDRDRTAFAQGASQPFEVWVDGVPEDGPYAGVLTRPTDGEALLRLTRTGEAIEATKRFVVRGDSMYTLDVRLEISAPGHALQIVLGHLPSGQRAVYLYDGNVHEAPLGPGTYTRFEGIGLVSRDLVYFLRFMDNAYVTPLVGREAFNPAGQPVFGLSVDDAPELLVIEGTLYSGRNRYLLLEAAGIEELGDVGLFSQFLIYVIRFLEWLYHATGNYGWAILLFTLLTRVLLYPLTRKQLRSMARMQRMQPKVQKLQERYKDDRAALQKQMMELYRKEGVNPLGGCLPMLLQFPLLILLWQAIIYSAEQIKLSPGFLWIRDLSGPDPFYILVILTTGLMLFQQWLSQRRLATPAAGGTQMIGWLFPVIMAVMFLNWPAGLWLYWFFTTALQVGQQAIVEWELAREDARTAPRSDGAEGD